MKVSTITMPQDAAKAKLKAFRANVHLQAEQEYEQAVKGYAALAKGQALLDISKVFRECEFDVNGNPKLAICRADAKEVQLERPGASFMGTYKVSDRELRPSRGRIAVSMDILVRFGHAGIAHWSWRYAQVPMIPADIIPAKGERKDWHILWEVDHWADKPKRALASKDPMLLKHVSGSLYAVIAEWDLTPLEQAIMNQAIRA